MLAGTPSRDTDTRCPSKHDNNNSARCQATLTCIIVKTITKLKVLALLFQRSKRPLRTLTTVMFRGTHCIKA